MGAIAKCENLTALVFDASLNSEGVKDFSKLLRLTKMLDRLFVEMRDINCRYDVTVSDYKKLVSAASSLLKKNSNSHSCAMKVVAKSLQAF